MPGRTAMSWAPSRRDPPVAWSSWSGSRCTTWCAESGDISVVSASGMSSTPRANATAASWNPKHMPRYGTSRSRAASATRTMPSAPRVPNPPGTSMPSYPDRSGSSPTVSESTKSMDMDTPRSAAACRSAWLTLT